MRDLHQTVESKQIQLLLFKLIWALFYENKTMYNFLYTRALTVFLYHFGPVISKAYMDIAHSKKKSTNKQNF